VVPDEAPGQSWERALPAGTGFALYLGVTAPDERCTFTGPPGEPARGR
jgi:hypothetical protein